MKKENIKYIKEQYFEDFFNKTFYHIFSFYLHSDISTP